MHYLVEFHHIIFTNMRPNMWAILLLLADNAPVISEKRYLKS